MTFFSSFKKALLILLSLGLISTVNAMEEKNEEYFIATSANCKTLKQASHFNRVVDNSRDAIEDIVQGEQHLIFMIKGTKDNVLQKIPEIFGDLVKKYPERIWSNVLYSGGLTANTKRYDEDHDSLVVASGVKFYYGNAIKNVYAPNPKKKGYSIEFDQARVSYEIKDPNQLEEFWHTEPAAMEQFLIWKHIKNQPIKNVILVSKKPMCKSCSAFLLHCFCIEAMKGSDVNFTVLSLPMLKDLAISELKDLLLTAIGSRIIQRGEFKGKEVDVTLLDRIKEDLNGDSGNMLSIYGF